ncbi:MAG: DUF47 domain-containing protein [Haloarculaceae archaeon]
MAAEANFGEQLEEKTDAYLDRLVDCVNLLPDVLDQYETGGEYEETVERIQTLENDCDRRLREITGFISNAGPQDIGVLNTRITFNESALIEFYQNVDVVANLSERIAQELVMMRPESDTDCFEGLREMADLVVSMTTDLESLVERFVHSLSTTDATDTLTDEIRSIRKTESECDKIRNDVIATAFRDDAIDEPHTFREFAILLDEVANKMEDITDQIVIISSNEPGIVTEADPESDGE